MTYSLAITVNTAHCDEHIISTLSSILRQSSTLEFSIYLLFPGNSGAEAETTRQMLRQYPWYLDKVSLHYAKDTDRQGFPYNSEATHFLAISQGDQLIPGALSTLQAAMETWPQSLLLGLCRQSNGSESWSNPDIFSSSIRAYHEDLVGNNPRLADSDSYVTCLPAPLADGSSSSPQTQVFLQEYICQRHVNDPSRGELVSPSKVRKGNLLPPIARDQSPVSDQRMEPDTDPVWIFAEREGTAAEDNAFALFEYCLKERQDIECYYVLESTAHALQSFPYTDKLLVKGSSRHKEALARSTHFLFTDSVQDVLDDTSNILAFLDRTHVFLTHGYLAYSPGVYLNRHQYIDHVVCTSLLDIRAAASSWGFGEYKFLRTGLPRWDKLEAKESASVLVCLTWRKVLDSSTWKDNESPSDQQIREFEGSTYFKGIEALLLSPDFQECLVRHNLKVQVRLHFRLQQFLHIFKKFESSQIAILSDHENDRPLNQLMEESALLITDYSSIMWDMAYMSKPVICYQFDKPAMLAERDRIQFSLLDCELPFAVTNSPSGVSEALSDFTEAGFRYDKDQLRMLSEFIPLRDGNNRKRLVDSLLSLTSKEGSALSPASVNVSYSSGTSLFRGKHESFDKLQNSAQILISGFDKETGDSQDMPASPSDWLKIVEVGETRSLVVEPHANAKSPWASVFFSAKRFEDFSIKLSEVAQQFDLDTELRISHILPFAGRIRSSARHYSKVHIAGVEEQEPIFEISVIVPVYNGAVHIASCLNSISRQLTNLSYEILVVDDGSTDDSANVIKSLASQDSRIKYVYQENARQGMARNRGILLARGKYVTFVDSDDTLHPEALAKLWHACQINGTRISVGLVASTEVDSNRFRINQSYFHYTKAPERINAKTWQQLFYDPSSVAKLIDRRLLLDNHLFFPQSYHEDQAFCFQLYTLMEDIAIVPTVLYYYLSRPAVATNQRSGTQTFNAEKFRQILLAGLLAADHISSSGLDFPIKQHALGFQVLRYDRFIWKFSQQADQAVLHAALCDAEDLLSDFLDNVSVEAILEQSRYFPLYFLLVKVGELSIAREVVTGSSGTALSILREHQILSDGQISALENGQSLASPYDYFRAHTIDTSALDRHLVTELCYGYRLGDIFVSAFKSPKLAITAPLKLSVLFFDMITRRGRRLERAYESQIRNSSHHTMESHSDLVKATASYQLGVVILEAFSTRPATVFKLPSTILAIYNRTKPKH